MNQHYSHALFVSLTGNGCGAVFEDSKNLHSAGNPNEMQVYPAGKALTLIARPAPGSVFKGWGGAIGSRNHSVSFVMNDDLILTADFALKSYGIVANCSGPGEGSITYEPEETQYLHGTIVKVIATPAQGSDFTGWSGDLNEREATCLVVMDEDKAFNANFACLNDRENLVSTDPNENSGLITESEEETLKVAHTLPAPRGDLVAQDETHMSNEESAPNSFEQSPLQSDATRSAVPAMDSLSNMQQRVVDHGDGTVTDLQTGLMWMRCAEGQGWTKTGCVGRPRLFYSDEIKQSNFAGYSDWRLPTVDELLGSLDLSATEPGCEPLFSGLDVTLPVFWTSTLSTNRIYSPNECYCVDFKSRQKISTTLPARYYVRFVRDTASEDTTELESIGTIKSGFDRACNLTIDAPELSLGGRRRGTVVTAKRCDSRTATDRGHVLRFAATLRESCRWNRHRCTDGPHVDALRGRSAMDR